ncbi:hypothetical protein HMPREF9389_2219 [Streptococcus sanguinis SK355]|uniref:Uncharacterized protein n=1 Tax=Streptococcus sanguinis SK355 TaxID=888816 RepID=F3UTR1_STRSA|nr:hypothetical protein HMPREF9389_2219 [Streptococcus sanguinis SK355]
MFRLTGSVFTLLFLNVWILNMMTGLKSQKTSQLQSKEKGPLDLKERKLATASSHLQPETIP